MAERSSSSMRHVLLSLRKYWWNIKNIFTKLLRSRSAIRHRVEMDARDVTETCVPVVADAVLYCGLWNASTVVRLVNFYITNHHHHLQRHREGTNLLRLTTKRVWLALTAESFTWIIHCRWHRGHNYTSFVMR